MDSGTQLIALAILLLVFIGNVVFGRRRRQVLRPLQALTLVPRLTGESIEAGRPLHLSLGSAQVGTSDTLIALAGADFLYEMTRQVAVGDAAPIITTSSGVTLPLVQNTLQRTYAGLPTPLGGAASTARWYPAGTRSLAFAAALSTMQGEDRLSGNVLAGSYGVELALILDASIRHDNPTIAVSDQLEGQAVAYAMADGVLIGEEVFAAPAYLSDAPNFLVRTQVIDRLRPLLAVAIILLVIVPPLLTLVAGEG